MLDVVVVRVDEVEELVVRDVDVVLDVDTEVLDVVVVGVPLLLVVEVVDVLVTEVLVVEVLLEVVTDEEVVELLLDEVDVDEVVLLELVVTRGTATPASPVRRNPSSCARIIIFGMSGVIGSKTASNFTTIGCCASTAFQFSPGWGQPLAVSAGLVYGSAPS